MTPHANSMIDAELAGELAERRGSSLAVEGAPVPEATVTAAEDLCGWPPFAPSTAFYLGRWQTFRDVVSSLPFLLLDTVAVTVAVDLASGVAAWLGLPVYLYQPSFYVLAVGVILLFQWVHGLYPACGITYSVEYRRLLRTGFLAAVSLGSGLLLRTSWATFPALEFALFISGLILLLSSLRSLARHLLASCDWWTQPVVLIGNTERSQALYERLDKCRNEGLRPLGVLYDPEQHWGADEPSSRSQVYIGPVSELENVLLRTGTCRVALADNSPLQKQVYYRVQGIPHVMLAADLGEHPTERVRLVDMDGRVSVHCHSKLTCPMSLASKRLMDLGLVLVTLPFWFPLMVAIGLAIKLTDPGPIFYRQTRVGRFGRSFRAIKFRSMVCDADQKLKRYLAEHPELQAEWEATHKLKNDPRVTWIGQFLRKTSLDELPQLLNVLRGEMSLVGPRPIVDCGDYDRIYIDEHPEVFELYKMVRPGITGLWQISGRNSLPYRHRVLLDRVYLHNWSLSYDIFILWRTLKTALFREGAY